MKIAILLCMTFFVAGCSYLPPKFDQIEYSSIVQLATLAQSPKCEVARVEQLQEQSHFAKNYAQHIPNNEDTFNSLVEIDVTISKLVERVKAEPVSPKYCSMKHYHIELMTQVLLDAVARKPR